MEIFLKRMCSHYSIQDSVVIIAHGGETWLEQGGRTGVGASITKPCKIYRVVSQWFLMEGNRIICGKGEGRGAWGALQW